MFKANKSSFQSVVTNWCTPSLSDDFAGPKTNPAYEQCMLNRKYLIENLGNYDNVIFSGAWKNIKTAGQINDMEKIFSKASSLGTNIIVMAAPKSYSVNPLEVFKKSIYFGTPFNINDSDNYDLGAYEANAKMKKLADKYDNVHFIDRTYLYDESDTFNANGLTVPYSYDGGHISILGSKYSAKYFMAHTDYDRIISYLDF